MLDRIKRKIGNEYWWTLTNPCKNCLVKPSCKIPSPNRHRYGRNVIDCPEYNVFYILQGAHFPTERSLKTHLLLHKSYTDLFDKIFDE